jgi:pyridinium-3,5-biscarboxylic acid mononucleotide sulfurtransferase
VADPGHPRTAVADTVRSSTARADATVLDRAVTGIRGELRGVRRLGVAYSGGIDSSVLLALAVRILGVDDVLALLAVSPSLAADDRVHAHDVAAFIGATVVEIHTRELENADYQANRADRCFFCKNELFTRIDRSVRERHRLDAVAYGENADDVRRIDRPGARAATEHGVLRPLARIGLTKSEVRAAGRALGLPNADKPASPCLASRIPHDEAVTADKLRQIDAAETALRGLGFTDLRVRHHGDTARVELAAGEIPRALREPLREKVIAAVTRCGFATVTIDPGGIRSGAFTLAVLRNQRT